MMYSNRDSYLAIKQFLVLFQLKVLKGVIEDVEYSYEEKNITTAINKLIDRVEQDMTIPYFMSGSVDTPINFVELSELINSFASTLAITSDARKELPNINNTRGMTELITMFPRFTPINDKIKENMEQGIKFPATPVQAEEILDSITIALTSIRDWCDGNTNSRELPQLLALVNMIELTEYLFVKFNTDQVKPEPVSIETYQEEEDGQS